MNWLDVIQIIGRILSGAIVIGFFLGSFLGKRFPVLYDVYLYSGIIAILVGLMYLTIFAVLGG